MKQHLLLIALLVVANNSQAGVYKCTDKDGNTFYQSSPCVAQQQAAEINTKTGQTVDLTSDEQKQQELDAQTKEQQAKAEQERLDKLNLLKQQFEEETAKTRALIKQKQLQFSAYAIPQFEFDKLPPEIQPFTERLPDFERFRRLAAEKALASGKCQRVEGNELSRKSKAEQMIFMVSCSTGTNFTFNEQELGNP